MTIDRFAIFLQNRRGDLRRIASRTNGEQSIGDLSSEAWLLAIEIGRRRGFAFDFADENDQDVLLAWMHNRFVRYADKVVRHAVKLDRDWDSADSESASVALARLLTAPLESDPHAAHQAHEHRNEFTAIVRRSYSQAAAYVVLLMRVDWHMEDLAALLRVGIAALRDRLKAVGLLARIQPTLFDGIEEIDPDFVPWKRSSFVRRSHAADLVPQVVMVF